jgi:hypothetical protein
LYREGAWQLQYRGAVGAWCLQHFMSQEEQTHMKAARYKAAMLSHTASLRATAALFPLWQSQRGLTDNNKKVKAHIQQQKKKKLWLMERDAHFD